MIKYTIKSAFPSSSVVKDSAKMQEMHLHESLIPGWGGFPGGGHGNPLQCSCLENPMDRGAWWATVHGVTNSWTRLSTHAPSNHNRSPIRSYLQGPPSERSRFLSSLSQTPKKAPWMVSHTQCDTQGTAGENPAGTLLPPGTLPWRPLRAWILQASPKSYRPEGS